MPEANYPQLLYRRAVGMLHAHGILSIVFGAIGVLSSMFVMLLLMFAISDYNVYQVSHALIMTVLVLILWFLPYAYLIIAGIFLVRDSTPVVIKTLVITNLIVGVLWNWILVIFAIINLTQMSDYERGYKK